MTRLLKTEFKRAILNRNFAIIVCIGIALTIMSIYVDICYGDVRYITGGLTIREDMTPFYSWMSEYGGGTWTNVFFMALPILAVIPYSDSYWIDKRSGFVKSIYTKARKRDYLVSKYIATFVTGGLAILIPLIVNLTILFMIFPAYTPSIFATFSVPKAVFAGLYYGQPYLYLLVYLLIAFLTAGIFACIGLAISSFCMYRFLVVAVTYIIFISMILLESIGLGGFAPIYFIRSGAVITGVSEFSTIVSLVLLCAISIIVYIVGVKKDEIA